MTDKKFAEGDRAYVHTQPEGVAPGWPHIRGSIVDIYEVLDDGRVIISLRKDGSVLGSGACDPKYLTKIFPIELGFKPGELAEVNGEAVEVVYEFPILYSGWECDHTGWVVKNDAGINLVLTDHGDPYYAKPEELRTLMEKYKATMIKTGEAYRLLEKTDNV